MTPFLIGGTLIFLVGTAMLLHAAYLVSTLWLALVALVPPLQPVFAALHWKGAWDALLMQAFGLVMVAAFFAQNGGFESQVMQQSLADAQRQVARQFQAPSARDTVNLQGEQAAQEAPPVIDNSMVEVKGDETATAPTAVTAAPSKAVNDKPIYKCTDPQGNETYSAEPCKGAVTKSSQ